MPLKLDPKLVAELNQYMQASTEAEDKRWKSLRPEQREAELDAFSKRLKAIRNTIHFNCC